MSKNSAFFFFRVTIFSIVCLAVIVIIVKVFWEQEVKYQRPTQVPESYQEIVFGETIAIGKTVDWDRKKPLFLHFFQRKCPCSRFNVKKFKSLVSDYGDVIDFRVLLQSEEQDCVESFIQKYDVTTPVIQDILGKIADSCGVYSTPQVVIINTDNTLYYRGNYNKAKFCTQKQSDFASIALDSLLAGGSLPLFSEKATTAYGCSLPSDSTGDFVETTFLESILY